MRAFDNLALLMLFAEMAHFDPIELCRLEVQCSKLDEMVKKHDVFPHASVDADRQQAQTPRARRLSLGNWVLKNGRAKVVAFANQVASGDPSLLTSLPPSKRAKT